MAGVGTASPGAAPWPAGRVLRVATRGSTLARRQVDLVADLVQRVDPSVVVEPVVVHTRGDRLTSVPLDRIGGQGAFAKEVQSAVLAGRADAAVHSAKDLPAGTPEGLVLVAVPERADPRDALVGSTLDSLAPGAVVATGSARRRAQLANLRADLTFVELRGNMGTRVRRAADGAVGAVVVAVAALDRLGWRDSVGLVDVLSPTVLLPQIGQGALAVECRSDDPAATALLASVDHRPSRRAVEAERSLLEAMGANCTVPIAGWAVDEVAAGGATPAVPATEADPPLRLRAMVASGDGRVLIRRDAAGGDPRALGRTVARLLLEDSGGSEIAGWAFAGGRPEGEAADRGAPAGTGPAEEGRPGP